MRLKCAFLGHKFSSGSLWHWLVPVLLLTRRKDLMGALVNGRLTNIVNVCITLVVTILNIILLYTLFWG